MAGSSPAPDVARPDIARTHLARPDVVRRRVTVVHAPACHFCDDAQSALAEIGRDVPLDVELVEAAEPGGQQLLREHGAGMLPLVLLDGVYFSAGRLPRRKLVARLARTATADVEARPAAVR